MAKAAKQPTPVSTYELMGTRIQRIINAPAAQKAKSALIYRSPDEDQADWDRIIGEIAENDNVTLAHRDDGGIQLFWTVPAED